MRRAMLILPALLLAAPTSEGAAETVVETQRGSEQRCGWISNPTPGNHSLIDREREWLLSSQGGYRARGMDNMPDMTTSGWVKTNGNYGHGCGCLRVRTDPRNSRITQLYSARPVPLAQCRRDRRLPRAPR